MGFWNRQLCIRQSITVTVEFWRFARLFDDTFRADAITCWEFGISDDSVDVLTEPQAKGKEHRGLPGGGRYVDT